MIEVFSKKPGQWWGFCGKRGYTEDMDIVDTPQRFREFLRKYPARKLKKGWPLLYQGEIPRTAYVVKSGMVKVYDINANGEEKVITFTDVDGLLAPEWLFNKSRVSLFYADAFTDAEVHAVPRQELFDVLHEDAQMLRFGLNRYINLYVGAQLHISALEQSRAVEKLLRIFQWMAIRFGEEQGPNIVRLNIRLTQQDLARMIGMTRETTTVELGKLRDDKVVLYQKKQYVLNLEKIQKILGEDEFRALSI